MPLRLCPHTLRQSHRHSRPEEGEAVGGGCSSAAVVLDLRLTAGSEELDPEFVGSGNMNSGNPKIPLHDN